MDHDRYPFIKDPKDYIRNLNIVEEANRATAHYLHLKTGKSFEECLKFVEDKIQNDERFRLKPIEITGLRQLPNEDRVLSKVSISTIIDILKRNNHIFSANMVMYNSSESKPSPIKAYITKKKKARKIVKKLGYEADQKKDTVLFQQCENAQKAIKRGIASISGAHISPHNPLFNISGHTSLTSTARVTVSYPNASTERFVSGNRHYWCKDVVIENILTITLNTDYSKLDALIEKYNIYIPTVDEVMDVILRSTQFYWYDEKGMAEIKALVETLSDSQIVSFVYTGDFYQFYTRNDELARSIFDSFLDNHVQLNNPTDEMLDDVVNKANSNVQALACKYCYMFFKGSTLSDVKKNSRENYITYAESILHIEFSLVKYSDLIKTLLTTDNLPPSIFRFPNSIRRAVIGSDTDSVMYTVQRIVIWYFGKLSVTPESVTLASIVNILNNGIIDHVIAQTLRQLGVADDDLFTLQMKNEYDFLIYARANRAKHYGTLMTSREGILFEVPKIELKGVGLVDSKILKEITSCLKKEMISIMNEIVANGKVKAFPIMHRISNLEHIVLQSLKERKITYLVGVNINMEEAYKDPKSSNYLYYEMWEDVFAEKYGHASSPPYRAVKISTIVTSKTRFTKWNKSIDSEIGNKLAEWMAKNEKDYLRQILLPMEIVSSGIPEELISLIDIRSTIADISKGFYILLEMLGLYFGNEDDTQLLSDRLPYDPRHGVVGDYHLILEKQNE